PMIFTTNKPLAAWGRVLHDADLAEAILDRVLERGRHLELRGRSYRTRHAPLDLTPASEPPSPGPARISGNHRPEFSEPTPPQLSLSNGTITLRRPRVRGLNERFESRLLPAFKRRTEEVGRLLPELYRHGLAQADFDLA